MSRSNFFSDILKEHGKYSQSRVYLLWSIIAYYSTIGILTAAGLNREYDIDVDKFTIIIDALEYAMVLFASYTFGGKFLDVVKIIGTRNSTTNKNDEGYK